MPDSPARSSNTPNKDHEQRFAIGVTRVCLSSGTLQIPFAMRGVLEPGTYLAHDTQLDEAHELDFEPPRSLVGLDAVFTAHELQPNDEVLLTITKDGLELDVKKRPRRKAPQMKGEPWESVRGAGAGSVARVGLDRAAEDAAHRVGPGPIPEEDHQPIGGSADEPAMPREDADAPRMVRARRRDTGRSIGSDRTPGEPSRRVPSDASGARHPGDVADAASHQGRVRERGAPSSPGESGSGDSPAKRFYEDSGYGERAFETDELSAGGWEWERPDRSEGDARGAEEAESRNQGTGFFAKIARTVEAAKGALSFRGAERDEESPEAPERAARPAPERQRYVPASLDDVPSLHDVERHADRTTEQPARRRVDHGADDADAYGREQGEIADIQRAGRDPQGAFGPQATAASRPEDADRRPPPQAPPRAPSETPERQRTGAPQRAVVVEDSDADTMDQHGPPMWDLGEGDLRQRMIRFLQHPDVPVILRTEMVARNFGLGEEVADAMLEDLTNDKIDGLVVTKVRDETYRISRAPTKL